MSISHQPRAHGDSPAIRDLPLALGVFRETNLAEALFESANVCLAILGVDGRLTALNAVALRGLSLEGDAATLGKSFAQIWPEAAHPGISSAVRDAGFGMPASFQSHMGGENAPIVDVSLKPLHANGAKVVAILASWGQAPATTPTESLRSERVEALADVVETIAHDLNNVFASASSALRIVARNAEGDRNAAVAVQGQETIDRGALLVRRMLDFVREVGDEATEIRLSDVLVRFAPLIRALAGPSIHVSIDAPVDVWPTTVVTSRFASVVRHLVTNAREAMPTGGELRIVARNIASAECPERLAPRDYASLEFLDAGEGMPPATLEKAGQLFFTTKEQDYGGGLGLASAFAFAEEAGGRCFIASQPGRGASVKLYLPRTAPRAAPE